VTLAGVVVATDEEWDGPSKLAFMLVDDLVIIAALAGTLRRRGVSWIAP